MVLLALATKKQIEEKRDLHVYNIVKIVNISN